MEIPDFNKYYLSDLTETLSSHIKKIVLIGDFNVDLLKYDNNNDVSNFLDTCILIFFFFILQVQLEFILNQVMVSLAF